MWVRSSLKEHGVKCTSARNLAVGSMRIIRTAQQPGGTADSASAMALPWAQAAVSGTASIAISTVNRTMYYRVTNTTVNWYGICRLDSRYLFSDTLKHWFGNRALAADTCLMFVSERSGVGIKLCSLFIFNYGAPLGDTLFRCALPTTNSAAVETTYVTFEVAVKDSNKVFPLKFPNEYFMPCIFFQLKVSTSSSTTNYDIYGWRVLTDWRNH